MFLKLSKVSDPHLKQPIIVSVAYGGEEDSEGVYQGAKRYHEKVALGEVIEVSDEVGTMILGTYAKNFKVVAGKDAPTKALDKKAPDQ